MERVRNRRQADDWWEDYHTHEELTQWANDLADTADGVETEVIGQSYEGRDMTVLRIMRARDGAPNMWVEAGVMIKLRGTEISRPIGRNLTYSFSPFLKAFTPASGSLRPWPTGSSTSWSTGPRETATPARSTSTSCSTPIPTVTLTLLKRFKGSHLGGSKSTIV